MQRKQAVLNPQTDKERFEEFVGTISAVAKEVQRIKANESAKLGLQGADIMVLYYLGQSDTGLTGADLARASGCTRAAVSRTLARMEREGFVKVGEGSGESAQYRAPVTLTAQGREAAAAANERIGFVMKSVSAAQTDAERNQMYASLAQVLQCLKGLSRE